MTNDNHCPHCMWVSENDTESFSETPSETVKEAGENTLRCTKDSVVAYMHDGTLIHACEYHAPEDMLNEAKLPVPQDRHSERRISV